MGGHLVVIGTQWVRRAVARTVLLFLATVFPQNMYAQEHVGQVLEDFEAVQPSWRVIKGDSLLRMAAQRRSDRAPVRGRRCEYLSVLGIRGGEQILVAHEIPSYAAIEEFRANLWVRGNRSGYQLMVRARLPRTLDDDGQPISVLLLGDQYASPGQWQQLVIDEIASQIADKTRVLRLSRGQDVDPTNAYIDMVLLNVYGGAGVNRVWIDDLTVQAAVAWSHRPRDEQVRQATHQLAVPSRDVSSQIDRLFVDDELFTVRAVTHHGEPFQTLKELGFNTIWLDQPPRHDQLESARQEDLWLISKPPKEEKDFAQCDRVIAWCIGKNLQTSDALETRRVAQTVRSLDAYNRPHLVTMRDADVSWPEFADIVVDAGASPAAGNGKASRWRLLGEPLGASSRWMSLRHDINSNLAQGYENYILQTGQSLETPESHHPRRLAELFNLELQMVRPWLGQHPTGVLGSPPLEVALLAQNHSSLAIVNRTVEARTGNPLRAVVEVPDANDREVFLVEPGGLSPVSYRRVPGGSRIELDPGTRHVKLLLTNRSAVVQDVTRFLREVGPRAHKLLADTAREELLRLDRRIEHSAESRAAKSQWREQLHALQSNVASFTETPNWRTITFRQLEDVLWGLEALQRRVQE